MSYRCLKNPIVLSQIPARSTWDPLKTGKTDIFSKIYFISLVNEKDELCVCANALPLSQETSHTGQTSARTQTNIHPI